MHVEKARPKVPCRVECGGRLQTVTDAVVTLSKSQVDLQDIIRTSPDFLFRLCGNFIEQAEYLEAIAAALRLAEVRIVEAAAAKTRGG
jgi:hypothetical protein